MRGRRLFLLLVVIVVGAAACGERTTPTATMALPAETPVTTAVASATAVVPAATVPPTATTVPATATVAPTPTLVSTATPAATATPLALTITSPAEDASLAAGSEVTVSGVAPAGTTSVQIALTAAGLELATAEAMVQATMWETTLVVPASLTGPASLRAALEDGSSADRGVMIAHTAATSGPAVSLTQPDEATIAVAGGVLFFTGRVQQPLENEITIAVSYDDCQTVAAQMSFDVGQGGQWWGYVVIPETVFGPACALAYTGTLGEGNWRGTHVPINVLEQEDPMARGLFIANFPEMEVVRGEPVTVYGHAFNVPNRQVQVSLVINGTAVAQGTTTVDRFGYWEIDLTVPTDVAVPAAGEFVVAATYSNGEVSQTVPFTAVAP